jgi:hypothetical protein
MFWIESPGEVISASAAGRDRMPQQVRHFGRWLMATEWSPALGLCVSLISRTSIMTNSSTGEASEPLTLATGKPWSDLDVHDLRAATERGYVLDHIAICLCRTEQEIRAKADEIGLALNELGDRK